MLRLVIALLCVIAPVLPASAQNDFTVQSYIVSDFELSPFESTQISKADVAETQISFTLRVLAASVPATATEKTILLTELAQAFVSRLYVAESATEKKIGNFSGNLELEFNAVESTNSPGESSVEWQIYATGTVSVVGELVRSELSSSIPDLFLLSRDVPVKVIYSTFDGTVFSSGSHSITYRSGKALIYLALVAFLPSFLVPYYWFKRQRERENKEIIELKRRATSAERKAERLEQTEDSEDDAPYPDVPVSEIPRILLDAIASEQAMVAFGAGASAQAGLPTSFELLFEIKQQFDGQLSERLQRNIDTYSQQEGHKSDPEHFTNVIEAISDQVGIDVLTKTIDDIFQNRVTSSDSFYDILADIGWGGALSLVWDNLADQSFARVDKDLALVGPVGHRCNAFERGKNFYPWMGIPGSVIDLIFDHFSNDPRFKGPMIFLLQDTFFFVGVSPSSLREYLSILDPSLQIPKRQHFALVAASFENELFVRPLAQYGVELIEYAPVNRHAEVPRYLVELSEKARQHRDLYQIDVAAPESGRWEAITGLRLINIGPFKKLSLDLAQHFDERQDGKGYPWTVITGENGQGKSIVLRSIAIALAARDERIQRKAGTLLKIGAREGKIELRIGDKTYTVLFVRDESYADGVRVSSSQQSPLALGTSVTLGFPALRGAPSRDPSGPRTARPRRAGTLDIYPLALDEVDDRMLDFKQWVVNVLTLAERGEVRFQRLAVLLDDIISDILPGDVIGLTSMNENEDFTLRVRLQDPTHISQAIEIPFDQMSQGMSSIFNWVGVLMQRLYENFEDLNDFSEARSTVIVDEIDVHLHPDWQRRLVILLKTHFPQVQVIASTHSALIVSSVYSSEVRVFRSLGDGDIELVQPARETFGQSANSLMQSETLGVANPRSVEFDTLISTYNELKRNRKHNSELEADYQALRQQLRELGWSGIQSEPAPNLSAERIEELNNKYINL